MLYSFIALTLTGMFTPTEVYGDQVARLGCIADLDVAQVRNFPRFIPLIQLLQVDFSV
jgi:hypothetical protein